MLHKIHVLSCQNSSVFIVIRYVIKRSYEVSTRAIIRNVFAKISFHKDEDTHILCV